MVVHQYRDIVGAMHDDQDGSQTAIISAVKRHTSTVFDQSLTVYRLGRGSEIVQAKFGFGVRRPAHYDSAWNRADHAGKDFTMI